MPQVEEEEDMVETSAATAETATSGLRLASALFRPARRFLVVVAVAVPEPAAAVPVIGVGGIGCLCRRRRRRSWSCGTSCAAANESEDTHEFIVMLALANAMRHRQARAVTMYYRIDCQELRRTRKKIEEFIASTAMFKLQSCLLVGGRAAKPKSLRH